MIFSTEEQLRRLASNRVEASETLQGAKQIIEKLESGFPTGLLEQEVYWDNLAAAQHLVETSTAYIDYIDARTNMLKGVT